MRPPSQLRAAACALIVVARASLQPRSGASPISGAGPIPVIDLGRVARGEFHDDDVAALRDACAFPGFFHVVNHGLSDEVLRGFEAAMRRFFALPTATKRRVKRTRDNSRGFADDEFTKRTRDVKELYDYGHAPRPDLPPDAPENRVMDGFNQIPDDLEGFREAIDAYYAGCARVCECLLRGVAASLGLPPDACDAHFGKEHTSYLRLNYYPAHAGERFASAAGDLDRARVATGAAVDDAGTPLSSLGGPRLGVNRHFDAGGLTLLLQDPDVSSLQVNLNAHGSGDPEWVDVTPVPGALTVNVGDMLQVLSNGKYKAPEHRVLASPPGKVRYSAPFFYNPAYDAEIAPLDRAAAPRYSPFAWGYFRRRRFEGDFADEGLDEIQIADYVTDKGE